MLLGLHNPLFPHAASDEGVQVDHLFSTLLGISTFVFVIVVGTLVYVVFRYGGRSQALRQPEFGESRFLHLTWTIVPIFIVIFMGTYSFIVLLDIAKPRTSELNVEVTAQQWSWKFYYPDAQVSSSELHLPVNKSVLLSMHSLDVIHSLWVPMFRIKQDVLPDRVTTLLLTPNQVGTF
ncbi:MAG: cytochrome c oxidase subunit II, partial [Anaerolineae bacterium]